MVEQQHQNDTTPTLPLVHGEVRLVENLNNIQMVSVESLWKAAATFVATSSIQMELIYGDWPAGPYVNACILCLQGASTGL